MNNQISYGNLIKEAWQITWKNKYLWWFGLLVSFSGGSGLNFNFPLNRNWEENSVFKNSFESKISEWAALYWEWIVLAGMALFLLIIICLILNVWGRGALIISLSKAIAKEPVNFKAGMREGKKFFWPIFGLSLFLFGLSLAALIILSTPIAILFYLKAYWVGAFLAFIGLFIFILLVFLFTYLQKFGILYLILGKVSLWGALENAYGLLRKHLLPSVIIGAIFFPLGFLAGLISMVFILIILLIFLIPGLLAYFLMGEWAIILLAGLGFIMLLAGILAINSIYAVFAQTLWILFFRQIALPKEEERIEEIATEIKPAEITEVPV